MNTQTQATKQDKPQAIEQHKLTSQFFDGMNVLNTERDDLLGAVLMFSTQRGASRRDIEDQSAAHGLDKICQDLGVDLSEAIPGIVEPSSSFKFAMRNAPGGFAEYMGRVIKEASSDTVQVGALMKRTANTEEKALDYLQERRFALVLSDEQGNKLQDPRLVCEAAEALTGKETQEELDAMKLTDEIGARVESLYYWHRDHLTPEQIRPWIRAVLKLAQSLKLQERGNCYFIPAPFLPIAQALCLVLKSIGCNGRMFPQYRDEWTLRETQDAFQSNGADEVASTLERIESFTGKINEGKSVRKGTISRLAGELEELEKMSELYQRLLSADITELQGKIEAAADKLSTLRIKAA